MCVCVAIYICVYRDGIVCRTQMGGWNFILMHLLTLSSNLKTAEQTEVGQGGNCPISAHYKVGVTSEWAVSSETELANPERGGWPYNLSSIPGHYENEREAVNNYAGTTCVFGGCFMQSGMKSEPREGLCVRMPGEEQPVFLLMKAGARPTLYTAIR